MKQTKSNAHQSLPVIEINNLSFSYNNRLVLDRINMRIEQGEFLGLVGPNGSGKTTLIKLILGIIQPQRGTVHLFGEEQRHAMQKLRAQIGYVSQKSNSFQSGFPATVFEVVSMGLFAKMGLFRWMGKTEKNQVHKVIALVGLTDYAKENINELSGGQQQRVFIARALVSEPKLLILDEPTVGVDERSVQQFYELLQQMHRQMGIALVFVTHDIGVISSLVDRVACLNCQIHFHGDPIEFEKNQREILDKAYGFDVKVIAHHHHH